LRQSGNLSDGDCEVPHRLRRGNTN